ncbi:MAG: hypothetical protein ACPGWM_08450, partial [Flavobacteriales bacterium]
MKFRLFFISILAPFFGLAQYALINEIGWVDSSSDSVWVEVYIPEQEGFSSSELKLYFNNKLVWFPDGFIPQGEYFSVELDADLFETEYAQKSIFSHGHAELELIYDGSLLHAAPMRCIPQNSSLIWQGFAFNYSAQPSRNQENIAESLSLNPVDLELNSPGGFYDQSIVVDAVNNLTESQSIHWNKGDVAVSLDSEVLTSEGIQLSSHGEPADLSYIEASGYQIDPVGEIHTAAVRSFQVFEKGCPVSEVSRNTYFLKNGDSDKYKLPVVSITCEDASLFSGTGIYGYGDSGINFDLRGSNWERPATIEYFEDGQLMLEQNIGLRIRGKS